MRGLDASTYEAWLASWSSAWDLPELPYRVRIVFSDRLQSSLGRCAPSEGLIRLNPGLLDGEPAALREVVCHEVAHVATWLLYGRHARAHGLEWKELMRLAGYDPRVRWAEAAVPDAVRERRRPATIYVHSCPVCRAEWIARRTSTAWRCATCRGAGRDGRLTVSKRAAPIASRSSAQ
jgi:predicted SprT family Zn-dependent metalloprotease